MTIKTAIIGSTLIYALESLTEDFDFNVLVSRLIRNMSSGYAINREERDIIREAIRQRLKRSVLNNYINKRKDLHKYEDLLYNIMWASYYYPRSYQKFGRTKVFSNGESLTYNVEGILVAIETRDQLDGLYRQVTKDFMYEFNSYVRKNNYKISELQSFMSMVLKTNFNTRGLLTTLYNDFVHLLDRDLSYTRGVLGDIFNFVEAIAFHTLFPTRTNEITMVMSRLTENAFGELV